MDFFFFKSVVSEFPLQSFNTVPHYLISLSFTLDRPWWARAIWGRWSWQRKCNAPGRGGKNTCTQGFIWGSLTDEAVLRTVGQGHKVIARFDFVLQRSNQGLRPVRTHLLIFIVKWKSISSTFSVLRKPRQTLSEQLMSPMILLLLLCAIYTVSVYLKCTSRSCFFFIGRSTSLSVKYLAIDTFNKHILHE